MATISPCRQHKKMFGISLCLEALENRTVLSAGNPDAGFGNGGIILTDFPGPTDSAAYSLASTSDGKLIAAGTSAGNFAVLRYQADGNLDPTFGNGGQAITAFSGSDQARAVAVQADGKIVAAGFSSGNFALARYLANGSLDTSFGTGGEVTTDLGANDEAFSVVVQPDGKIVAAGFSGFTMGMARYLPDGSLDPSFGNDGKVIGVDGLSAVFAVALQSDGKIIVGDNNGELARFLTNGSLDTSFGNGGVVNTNLGINEIISAVTVLPSDEILVGAQAGFALAEYQSNGSLDTSFGSGGVVKTDFGGDAGVNALAVANGEIVAAGYTNAASPSNYTYNFAVARYQLNGSPDASFGNNGKVITDMTPAGADPEENYAQAVAVLPSGTVVAAGYAIKNGLGNFALAGYQDDGTLDSAFGTGGIVRTEILGPGANDAASSVVVQSDGKIIAGGSTSTYVSSDFALTRYLSDGSLDPTFGSGGKVTSNFGGYDSIAGIAHEPDGRIVVAGSTTLDHNSYQIVVARYLANGDLDPSFGVNGEVTTAVGSSSSAAGIALQPDGKLVVAGTSGNNFAVVRYESDGSLDASFGTGGEITTAFPIGPQPPPSPPAYVDGGAVASGLAIEANGTIVVSGTVSTRFWPNPRSPNFTTDFGLARYLSNGQLDPSFGNGGEVMSHIDESGATSVVVQGDGKIVAAGWNGVRNGYPVYSLTNTDFALMRFLPDGSLDPAFGTGGQVTTHFGDTDRANAISLQPDGSILAAGSATGNVELVRYLADGALDAGFGVDGKVGDFSGAANALAMQSDGKVVVAGASAGDFILARYTAIVANDDTLVLGGNAPNAGSGATSVLANDVSPGVQPQNMVAMLDSNVAYGSLTLNPDGSFSYTPGANFQGIDRFTYHFNEGGIHSNTATVTFLSYNASLVDKLYQQVLHRPAEDAGLTYWTRLLDQGAMPDVVATGIFNSQERLNTLVTQFYEQYLLRPAEPSGLAYWVQDWQISGDPRDVVENILASQEFFDDAGGTNAGYIALLYQRVLGRPAEPSGLNYWVELMAPPANETRVQIASQFYDTHEKHADLVDFLFSEYFNGVSPLPSTQPYVTDLDDGETETQVEKAIIDSPDYRSNPPQPAPGTVGRALYPH